jgi:hypothetical protein
VLNQAEANMVQESALAHHVHRKIVRLGEIYRGLPFQVQDRHGYFMSISNKGACRRTDYLSNPARKFKSQKPGI